MTADRKIVTKYAPPPMSFRECDWQACFSDYDLGDPIGYGETEAHAILDLKAEAGMDE